MAAIRGARLVCAAMLVLAGCSESAAPVEEFCLRPDSGTACAQPERATLVGNDWDVGLFTTVRERVGYRDGDALCSRTVTTCQEKHCLFAHGGAMTEIQAIAECRKL